MGSRTLATQRVRFDTVVPDAREDAENPLFVSLADKYRVVRELGRGGMASVYLAEDLKHNRSVAIKIMRPEISTPGTTARFTREIEVAARLRHPHIVPLYDSGIVEGQSYYVMAYEPGETLRERLAREKQLTLGEALRIARQVTDAVAHAHDLGIVHRDIKPANILLSNSHAMLADFGIARTVTTTSEYLSTTGIAVGTPAYMSPEQGLGDRDLDGRSDVYSIGCVLYEMLVGVPPFMAASSQAILAAHRSLPVPSARVLRPGIPEGVEQVLRRALEKAPADRFRTAGELHETLSQLEVAARTGAPVSAPLPISPNAIRRWSVSQRPLALAGLALLVVAILAIVLRFSGAPRANPRRIAIFPLDQRLGLAAAGMDDIGLSVARLIGYRLASASDLEFVDAADYLSGPDRLTAMTFDRKHELSRSLNADYMIDGSVDPASGSSVAVVLRLRGVDDETSVQMGAEGQAADIPQLGLEALRKLLPAFLEPGRRIDAIAFQQRDPVAILTFLDAERAYRASQFDVALSKYEEAIEHDSLLAVAALKGAQAASWINRAGDANRLAANAVRHIGLLPPRYASYARALQSYLVGDGAEALKLLRTLVAEDPHWTDAWMLLGESYFHLAPAGPRPDSLAVLADSAYRMAGRADPEFSPAMRHLLDLSLRSGAVARVDSLAALVRPALPDSEATWLDVVSDCVRGGAGRIDTRRLGNAGPTGGWSWGEVLVFDPNRGGCGRSALWFTLATPNAAPNVLWGAIVGINASLMAAGRFDDAVRFVSSPAADPLRGWALLFVNEAAGAPATELVRRHAQAMGADFKRLSTPRLWLLTTWYSRQADSGAVRQIERTMVERRDSSNVRLDSLVAAVVAAHSALVRRDTTLAMRRFAALVPRAAYEDLMWQPWEAFAGERLILARLHETRREYADAIRVAAILDAPAPMVNLVFLQQSFEIRERAARALGDTAAANAYRDRRTAWLADRARFP